ncbi:uncharacterized protein [Ptychodera flava]|uniref:uncharacterized protein n=1 Tax=Ptychodera flava TaxID=63121 RepID=UPI00396A59A2
MQKVEIKGDTPTAQALHILLNFIYYGKLDLKSYSVEEVIAASSFLFVSSVWTHFADIITLKNWKTYLGLAEKYNITELKDLIYRYLNCNYSVLQGDMFFHKAKLDNTNFSQGYLSQFRDSQERFTTKVIAVAGFYKDKQTSSPAIKKHGHIVSFYDALAPGWKFLAALPVSLRSNNAHVDVTGWDDTIYAVGGKGSIHERESNQFLFDLNDAVSVSKSFSYNTRIGEWRRTKSPNEKAFGKTRLVSTEKMSYLLHGGFPGIYRYDPTDNSWQTVPMETRSLRDCCYDKGVIYMLCRDWGLSSKTCHIARFYTESEKFVENLDSEQVLPSGRCTHVTSLDGDIYVIDDAMPFNCFVFRYDPVTNSRTLLSSSPIREFGFKEGRGAIGFHGCIYYLGEHKVAVFDVADVSWRCLPSFPRNFDPKSMFVLTVPRDLAQVSPDIL